MFNSANRSHEGHHHKRRRRGALQRLWPLRSPFFQMPSPHPMGLPMAPPPMIHHISNNHQPPINYRPLVTFKPWLAAVVNQNLSTENVYIPTTTTTTTMATPPTITTTIAPITSSPKSTTLPLHRPEVDLDTATTVVNSQHSHHYNHAQVSLPSFDPFKPYKNPSKINSSTISRTKEAIRLRYQENSYLNSTVLEMPFIGGIVSMLVLLPDSASGSLDLMLSRLNAQLVIDLLQSLEIRKLDITVPLMKVGHSIDNLDRVFNRMGLSKVFDYQTSDEFRTEDSFAGIKRFPIAKMMNIFHKTLLDIKVLDNDEEMVDDPQQQKPRMVRSFHYNLTFDSSSFEVSSPIMKIVPSRHTDDTDDIMEMATSKNARKQDPEIDTNIKYNKLLHKRPKQISLDEETFIYLIIDNISGLILSMGKHFSES